MALFKIESTQTDMKGVATVCLWGFLPPPYSHASSILSRMWTSLTCCYFYPSVCSFLCLFISQSVAWAFVFSLCILPHTHSLSLSLSAATPLASWIQPPLQSYSWPSLSLTVLSLADPPIIHAVEGADSLSPPWNNSHCCVFETGVISTWYESWTLPEKIHWLSGQI